ncbi:MAG: signal peptidase I [Candidatus Bathyarchaeia archaeon]
MGDGLKEYAKYFLLFVVLAAVAFGGIQLLKSTLKTKYPIMVVVSQSMVPTLGVGDYIVVDHVDDFDEVVAAPQPEGDILVFLRPHSSDEYIVHRAVDKLFRDGEWWFVTKGDHNAVEDSQPVRESNVIGKVVARVPILGYFPLFIKTSMGFALVAGLMVLVFFADYIMPKKRVNESGGSFPWPSLIPFIVSPLTLVAFWFVPQPLYRLEFLALVSWYIGCLTAPLAFDDDDMGLMFWLYHFVLVMIPLGCDLVWWMTGISPSRWWDTRGSTVPITWLLQKESPMFYRAFYRFALLVLPGCTFFLLMMAAKRRGVKQFVMISKLIRSTSK